MTPQMGPGVGFRTYGGEGLIWMATAVTSGGVATFHPTLDGTAGGQACFSVIAMICHSATLNTSTATDMPFTSTKTIATDTITVNCMVGTVLGILGPTVTGAPDGTVVTLMVWGKP